MSFLIKVTASDTKSLLNLFSSSVFCVSFSMCVCFMGCNQHSLLIGLFLSLLRWIGGVITQPLHQIVAQGQFLNRVV